MYLNTLWCRFMYHSGGSKLEIPVEFPMQLEAEDVCSDSQGCAQPLNLVAMVCHFGSKLLVSELTYHQWLTPYNRMVDTI